MAFQLLTKNGHNMFDMSSMLQKAIRRADYVRAGYAANELFDKYNGYLWRRLLVISAEDCYGIMTKEIIALKQADELQKEREKIFVSKAIVLLCLARKNKDADYFACNYMQSDKPFPEELVDKFSIDEVKELPEGKIPDWVYSWHTRKGKNMGRDCVDSIIDDQLALKPHQVSLFDEGDWGYHIDKTLAKFNPKGRPHKGIDWSKITKDME
jgi:replication-associated recombination protein RarA